MVILVTGFEPFGGQEVNASWLAVRELPGYISEVPVIKSEIPCSYFKSTEAIGKLLDEHQDISHIILVGEAGGRSRISLEMIGVNYDDADLADNSGITRTEQKIDPDGPDGLFSTIPVKKLAKVLKTQEVSVEISWSAGHFLCNHTLYAALNKFGTRAQIGFVHVPYSPGQASAANCPGQSVEELIRGLMELIKAIVDGT